MRWIRQHAGWHARITLVMLVLSLLAPVASHALVLRLQQTQPWDSVCSSANAAQAEVAASAQGGQAADTGSHCPLCLTGHTPAAPAPTPALHAAPDLQHLLPNLFLQAGHTLAAWRPAQARAPPQGQA